MSKCRTKYYESYKQIKEKARTTLKEKTYKKVRQNLAQLEKAYDNFMDQILEEDQYKALQKNYLKFMKIREELKVFGEDEEIEGMYTILEEEKKNIDEHIEKVGLYHNVEGCSLLSFNYEWFKKEVDTKEIEDDDKIDWSEEIINSNIIKEMRKKEGKSKKAKNKDDLPF